MSADTYQKTLLPSGTTVVTERMPDRRTVSIGVWVKNGARDEPPEQLGISHFIEHMMFKGTERRDALAIARSLESLGGHLDAFTGREQVCYYARALSEHLPDVVDVLFDLVGRPRFAPPEVEREKSVVREEIFASEDNPEDKVGELLAAQTWPDHSLGRPILGTVKTLDPLGAEDLHRYFRSRYRADQLVVSAAGAIEHGHVLELVTRHQRPPDGPALPLSGAPPSFTPRLQHEVRDDLQQLYLSLATRAVSYMDDDRYPLAVLNVLLGGGMSSRLFQSVREEAGLAYSVFSALDSHRDAGMLSIHLGVSPARGREALDRLRQELVKLGDQGPTEEEVAMGRQQLYGSVIMGQESVSNRMSHLAQEEIYRGRYVPLEEQLERIRSVSHARVAALAKRFLVPEGFGLTALGPAPAGALDGAAWPTRAGA